MTDFFISYTQVDRPWAEWIAWQLEAAGYTTVNQAWDFRPGDNFVLAMDHAVAKSERTIVVLSSAYLQSGFTAVEWSSIFARDPTSTQGRLLPVRIQDCEPRGLLMPIVCIDLVGLDAAAAREELLAGVRRQRAKPTREPRFPATMPPLFPGAIPQNILQVAVASKFNGKGKIASFLEEYLVTETGLTAVPFGGRDEDFTLLGTWLDNETAPPRYLLTAPAGRGKSALLVRWLQHLQEQGRLGRDVAASWQLVFVPISVRFETHRPDTFYEALAARLAEILGEELPPTPTDKGVYYADHCRALASAAAAQGRRILIVLDGIDEALGERFDAWWFPRNPGTKLRLVCSARWQAGDLDSSGWKTRLGWERDVRVQSRELPVLAREGVRDLLIKMGAPTDVLASRPDIIDCLHELAKGEPLVLQYYAKDIWCMGETAPRLTIDDLAQMQPGFGAYFKRWLDDQKRLWAKAEEPIGRQRVDAILALLACAHGRLTGSDLQRLLKEGGEKVVGGHFLEQLQPIQRFVIGFDRPQAETAGYILSHPRLGIYLREEHFNPEYIQATQETFVRWGRKTVEQLNSGAMAPEDIPAYLVQYHTQHLQDTSTPDAAFLELVEQGWMCAWKTFEGGYRGFSRDIRLAYDALSKAHTTVQPRFAQRLRCQLVRSSIHSIGANTPWELLVAAYKAGVIPYRRVAHWLEFQPPIDRARALSVLVSYLPAEQRAEVLADALTAAGAIADSFRRVEALGGLVSYLPAEQRAEVLADALTAAGAIADTVAREYTLGVLAPHLPAELLPAALTVVQAIEDSVDRAYALGALASHLPLELPAEVLADALTVVQAIEDSPIRAYTLGTLVPHLPAALLPAALRAARAIEDSFHRVEVLGALVSHLPVELRAKVLADALTAAQAIEDSFHRAEALGALASHLPVELRAKVLADALTAAQAIEDRVGRVQALSELAPQLPTELLPTALTATQAIKDSFYRAQALGVLAPYLPAELLPTALTATQAIKDSFYRAQALGVLAPYLPAELLPTALTATQAVEDSIDRAQALGALASHLPVELRAEVLLAALTAVQALEDSVDRARLLETLAPYLPAELLPTALTAVQALEDSVDRARLLETLAPYLPAELLPTALTAAQALEDRVDRAQALGALASHLPVELPAEVLPTALTATRAIEDNFYRAQALSALAPQLPVFSAKKRDVQWGTSTHSANSYKGIGFLQGSTWSAVPSAVGVRLCRKISR